MENVERLRRGFPDMLERLKGEHRGSVVGVRDARPSSSVKNKFVNEGRLNGGMKMGVMFHGTDRASIALICRNGIHDHSCFTNSLHYALRRSQGKEGYKHVEVEVLAMAVLVPSENQLRIRDLRVNWSGHSMPLFIVTIYNT